MKFLLVVLLFEVLPTRIFGSDTSDNLVVAECHQRHADLYMRQGSRGESLAEEERSRRALHSDSVIIDSTEILYGGTWLSMHYTIGGNGHWVGCPR